MRSSLFLRAVTGATVLLALVGCGSRETKAPLPDSPGATPIAVASTTVFNAAPLATFSAPWSLALLPDRKMLVTERPASASKEVDSTTSGALWLVDDAGKTSTAVSGFPANIGVLDVRPGPDFDTNRTIFVSYVERDPHAPRIGRNVGEAKAQPSGIAVVRATLSADALRLSNVAVIWRQVPKIVSNIGTGEPGGRMAFSPDGKYLFVASGDRQELDAKFLFRLDNNLGKVVRIRPDGTVPDDNPYASTAGALPEIWSIGHRNPYGLAFNGAGELWESEMGPEGGDELNLIQPKQNYGWPAVSYGNNYGGDPIPKPAPGDGYAPSPYWWTPVIAPSEMIFYSGNRFAGWDGDAILSGLASELLVRVHIVGTKVREVQRIAMGNRIRCVREASDGSLWILEDQPSGRLVHLTPRHL